MQKIHKISQTESFLIFHFHFFSSLQLLQIWLAHWKLYVWAMGKADNQWVFKYLMIFSEWISKIFYEHFFSDIVLGSILLAMFGLNYFLVLPLTSKLITQPIMMWFSFLYDPRIVISACIWLKDSTVVSHLPTEFGRNEIWNEINSKFKMKNYLRSVPGNILLKIQVLFNFILLLVASNDDFFQPTEHWHFVDNEKKNICAIFSEMFSKQFQVEENNKKRFN